MHIALLVNSPLRDLDGLALVALDLCRRGHICDLVPANLFQQELSGSLPDFVLVNSLRRKRESYVRELIERNVLVGVLDDEGGVFSDVSRYRDTLSEDDALRQQVSCFCVWGHRLAEFVSLEKWFSPEAVTVTGAPRFDFYAQPLREAKLPGGPEESPTKRPLILLNGSFPAANPEYKTPELEIQALVNNGMSPEAARHLSQTQAEGMREFAALANRLAVRFPEVNFVYRPHPFENLETYHQLLEARDNLRAVKQGAVGGWIKRSVAVVQRGCTTAIESGMCGVPAFSPSWIPVHAEIEAVEKVSVACGDVSTLEENLKAALNGQFVLPESIQKYHAEVVHDWFGFADGLAHQRIADAILSALQNNNSPAKGREKVPVFSTLKTLFSRRERKRRKTMEKRAGQWRTSEKYFDIAQVKAIVEAVNSCRRSAEEAVVELDIRLANESASRSTPAWSQSIRLTPRATSVPSPD